ncbi:hypothetical protein EI555_017238, partial [Monodon monoceros]
GVDLSSPRPFCVFIVVYNYARLPSRHVCWVAWPLRLCLYGLVVVSGVCEPDYVGLCVPERLRLIDFVVSCWTMFGPDRVGLWGSVGLCLLRFPSMELDRVWPCPHRVVCLCADRPGPHRGLTAGLSVREGESKDPFHNLDLGSCPSPAGGAVEILCRGAALSKYAP